MGMIINTTCIESAVATKELHFMPDTHLTAISMFKSKTKYLGYDLGSAAGTKQVSTASWYLNRGLLKHCWI